MPALIALFSAIADFLIRLVAAVYARVEVVGREHLPREGGVILVSNHISSVDPELLAALLPRHVRWMAKQEIFDHPFTGPLARLFGAFPVRREEADLSALRRSLQALEEGQVIGIFPEGHRSRTGRMLPALPGAAIIALRSGAPVLPVAISGSDTVRLPHLFWRPFQQPGIRIVVGEPFTLSRTRRISSEAVKEGTDIIVSRIVALLPERYWPEAAAVET